MSSKPKYTKMSEYDIERWRGGVDQKLENIIGEAEDTKDDLTRKIGALETQVHAIQTLISAIQIEFRSFVSSVSVKMGLWTTIGTMVGGSIVAFILKIILKSDG